MCPVRTATPKVGLAPIRFDSDLRGIVQIEHPQYLQLRHHGRRATIHAATNLIAQRQLRWTPSAKRMVTPRQLVGRPARRDVDQAFSFRMDSPLNCTRWLVLTMRSKMASATIGLSM